jgi:hypothetical protein
MDWDIKNAVSSLKADLLSSQHASFFSTNPPKSSLLFFLSETNAPSLCFFPLCCIQAQVGRSTRDPSHLYFFSRKTSYVDACCLVINLLLFKVSCQGNSKKSSPEEETVGPSLKVFFRLRVEVAHSDTFLGVTLSTKNKTARHGFSIAKRLTWSRSSRETLWCRPQR